MKLHTHPLRNAGTQEVPNSTQRVHALEGTRGLAVLLVFFVHYHALFNSYVLPGSTSFAVSEFLEIIGHTGVDLFFALSGYLIYGIIIQKAPRYSTFLFRRIRRIYPTFLCVLALYILLSFAFPSRSKLPDNLYEACVRILQNIALLPGFFPIDPIITLSWSLSYEFVFYLSLPLFIGIIGMRSWRRWQRILLFLILVLLYFGLSLVAISGYHLRLVMFAVGILLRETLSCNRIRERLTRLGEIGAIVFYLGSLVLVYWVRVHPPYLTFIPKVRNLSWVSRVFFTASGGFAFGLYCFGFDGILNKILSGTLIRKLGEISYSYYLIHGLTLNGVALVVMRWLPPSGLSPVLFWSLVPCAFAITLATAIVLFTLVEKPCSLYQDARRSDSLPSRVHPSMMLVVSGADGVSVQQSAN